jgi:hypothetical protein
MPHPFIVHTGDSVNATFYVTSVLPDTTVALSMTLEHQLGASWEVSIVSEWDMVVSQTAIAVTEANQWVPVFVTFTVPATAGLGVYRVVFEGGIVAARMPRATGQFSFEVLAGVNPAPQTGWDATLVGAVAFLLFSLSIVVVVCVRRRKRVPQDSSDDSEDEDLQAITHYYGDDFARDPEGPPDIFAREERK